MMGKARRREGARARKARNLAESLRRMLSKNCETLFIHSYNFTPFLTLAKLLPIEKVELINKILN